MCEQFFFCEHDSYYLKESLLLKNDLPNLLGFHPFMVLPRSMSTNTRFPSIFLPSALLYAALKIIKKYYFKIFVEKLS